MVLSCKLVVEYDEYDFLSWSLFVVILVIEVIKVIMVVMMFMVVLIITVTATTWHLIVPFLSPWTWLSVSKIVSTPRTASILKEVDNQCGHNWGSTTLWLSIEYYCRSIGRVCKLRSNSLSSIRQLMYLNSAHTWKRKLINSTISGKNGRHK